MVSPPSIAGDCGLTIHDFGRKSDPSAGDFDPQPSRALEGILASANDFRPQNGDFYGINVIPPVGIQGFFKALYPYLYLLIKKTKPGILV